MPDGSFTIYVVQHKWMRVRSHDWNDSALDTILFGDLPYDDRRGDLGDRYRAVLKPVHECWQVTRRRGFLNLEDARAAYDACREAAPQHSYRIVKRTWAQVTTIEYPAAPHRVAA